MINECSRKLQNLISSSHAIRTERQGLGTEARSLVDSCKKHLDEAASARFISLHDAAIKGNVGALLTLAKENTLKFTQALETLRDMHTMIKVQKKDGSKILGEVAKWSFEHPDDPEIDIRAPNGHHTLLRISEIKTRLA